MDRSPILPPRWADHPIDGQCCINSERLESRVETSILHLNPYDHLTGNGESLDVIRRDSMFCDLKATGQDSIFFNRPTSGNRIMWLKMDISSALRSFCNFMFDEQKHCWLTDVLRKRGFRT